MVSKPRVRISRENNDNESAVFARDVDVNKRRKVWLGNVVIFQKIPSDKRVLQVFFYCAFI